MPFYIVQVSTQIKSYSENTDEEIVSVHKWKIPLVMGLSAFGAIICAYLINRQPRESKEEIVPNDARKAAGVETAESSDQQISSLVDQLIGGRQMEDEAI
jgi:hypothetical protein